MQLKCLGAGQEVGRSGFLLIGSDKVLFDYGIKLKPRYLNEKLKKIDLEGNAEEPIKINENINAIILSHAHIDHSGNIPALYKKRNPHLFLTQSTLDLSVLLWKDSIKIAKFEKKIPSFDIEDINYTMDSTFYLDLRKTIEITKNTKLTFYDAGHIVGGVISVVEMDGKKIMYSGDFRAAESSLFPGYDRDLPEVDYLIVESTYGEKNHTPRKQIENEFIEEVKSTIKKKGIVMIPSFAIERTQEIISILFEHKIKAEIYVDGMGVKATKIFLKYPEYFKNFKNFKKATQNVKFITDSKLRKKVLNTTKPIIIITTAGMLEGGPILLYLKEFGNDKDNKLIIVGYQVEGTNGDKLKNTGKLFVDGEMYEPNCEIKYISFSGHPGKDELMEFVNLVNPKKVICVHGERAVTLSLAESLRKEGYEVFSPMTGETIQL